MSLSNRVQRLNHLTSLMTNAQSKKWEIEQLRDVTSDPLDRGRYELHLNKLQSSIDEYREEESNLSDALRAELLISYPTNFEETLAPTLKNLSTNQLILLCNTVDYLKHTQLNTAELREFWDSDVEEALLALPPPKMPVMNLLRSPNSDVKQRLIFSLPFGILAYQVEWEMTSEFQPKQALISIVKSIKSQFSKIP